MKRPSILIPLIFVAIVATMMTTCTHKPQDFPVPITKVPTPVDSSKITPADTGLCFERDILPIFISNCTMSGCHDAITRAEGYELDNYQNIVSNGIVPGNAASSQLFQSLLNTGGGDPMPPAGALSAAQIALIQQWINKGALDSGACATNKCDTNNYTYSGAISPMMQLYCVGCHSTASGPAGNLANYNSVKVIALNGRLVGDISHSIGYNAMPKGGPQLSACQITQVEKWITAGALNN